MGGLIAFWIYMKGNGSLQGMILSSPLLQIPNKPLNRIIVKPIVSIANLLGKAQEKVKAFTFSRYVH